ncbi:hypothetical protein IT417_01195 [bacterium]|nr:hypothetical protein [bacterium]
MRYLKLPIKGNLNITEGWIYTQEERKIHHNYFHKGVDFQTSYHQPIFASADGFAVASYHRFPLNDPLGMPLLYMNKPLSNGLGLFVQIYHPPKVYGANEWRITQYGHLSELKNHKLLRNTGPIDYDLEGKIIRRNKRKRKYKLSEIELNKLISKFRVLKKKFSWISNIYGYNFFGDIYTKESYILTPDEILVLVKENHPSVCKVKQGEQIGYSGQSAVFYGNLPYNEDNIKSINEFENTWDEIHLHFEEATRNWKSGAKIDQKDAFGIYKSKKWYQGKGLMHSMFADL